MTIRWPLELINATGSPSVDGGADQAREVTVPVRIDDTMALLESTRMLGRCDLPVKH